MSENRKTLLLEHTARVCNRLLVVGAHVDVGNTEQRPQAQYLSNIVGNRQTVIMIIIMMIS